MHFGIDIDQESLNILFKTNNGLHITYSGCSKSQNQNKKLI